MAPRKLPIHLPLVCLWIISVSAQDPAVLAPCLTANASQAFHFSPQYGGVISSASANLCLCSLSGSDPDGPLTFQTCDGPGTGLHNQEIGYNASSPGPIPKAGTGLCVSASASGEISLQTCGLGQANQAWQYSSASQQFTLVSNASQCMTIGQPPPPLLSSIFGDHMVLQRDTEATLWGWTVAGGTVMVSVIGTDGHEVNVTSAPAGADGKWNVTLPPSPASVGGVGVSFCITDNTSGVQVVVVDVLFGDVSETVHCRWGEEGMPMRRCLCASPRPTGCVVQRPVQHEWRQHARVLCLQCDRRDRRLCCLPMGTRLHRR